MNEMSENVMNEMRMNDAVKIENLLLKFVYILRRKAIH